MYPTALYRHRTVQPCDTEWRLIVVLIPEYVPSVRHSATVSTQGR
jgi:hypothetical protein